MIIATYNINGVNRRLETLLGWLADRKPDVVCLQELKAEQKSFPNAAIEAAGYTCAWVGQKAWNGVAILSRGREPVVTRTSLPGDEDDSQARYIEAAVSGVLVASIYAPNGNPQPGPKFDYKLAWHARLQQHADELRKSGAPVVLAGDYNVVPTDLDIYPSKSGAWDDDALLQPESRAAFRELIESGWTDALRALHPDERLYTFWDYKRHAWPGDHGMRIDHLLLSKDVAARLRKGGVDRDMRGHEGASDHAPVWIELGG